MLKKISAVIASALAAGLLVTFVPGFAPPVQARTSPAIEQNMPSAIVVTNGAVERRAAAVKSVDQVAVELVRKGSRAPKIVCAQSWPHYGADCLHGNAADSTARAVRVIALDRKATTRIDIARR